LRREPHINLDLFKFQSKLADDEVELIYDYVQEQGYTHDELLKVLKNANIG